MNKHTPPTETVKTLEDEPDKARVGKDPVGRTAELRHGERMRGDNGGGPQEDGLPNVPHGNLDKEDPDAAHE